MNRFIGTWKLVSVEDKQPSGEVTLPYGERPMGLLIYDASGNVSVQIVRRHRRPLSSDNWEQAPADEIKTAVEGITSFFGTYQIDEADQTIIHRVEGHLFPNGEGKELRRKFEFSGSRLRLYPTQTRTVTWERF